MEQAFTGPGRFWIDNAYNAPPVSVRADLIWTIDPLDWEITRHVPRLGVGLSGYDLTSITQTIDVLSYRQIGNGIFSTQR
jgi:hypothetical protein